MKNLNFPDTIELSHLETAAAINSTIHFLRLKRLDPAKATLVEMMCSFLEHEREQLILSSLGTLYNRRRNELADTSEG